MNLINVIIRDVIIVMRMKMEMEVYIERRSIPMLTILMPA